MITKAPLAVLLTLSVLLTPGEGSIACPAIYFPVCCQTSPTETKTIANRCLCETGEGGKYLNDGECPASGDSCPLIWSPVCCEIVPGFNDMAPNDCVCKVLYHGKILNNGECQLPTRALARPFARAVRPPVAPGLARGDAMMDNFCCISKLTGRMDTTPYFDCVLPGPMVYGPCPWPKN